MWVESKGRARNARGWLLVYPGSFTTVVETRCFRFLGELCRLQSILNRVLDFIILSQGVDYDLVDAGFGIDPKPPSFTDAGVCNVVIPD